MDVLDIVRHHLVSTGAAGLCNSRDADGCACSVDDLAPCGEMIESCQPAVQVTCDSECEHDDDDSGWHYAPQVVTTGGSDDDQG